MKTILAMTCLLAAATAVRGLDQDSIIPKYMEYLMPDMKPCAEEFHVTEEQVTAIQKGGGGMDMKQLGCMKACVMKRFGVIQGTDFHLEPINKMIETVHADKPEDIVIVKKIATDCLDDIKGETDECNIGNLYTDCYIKKLFA
ncbi:PREDICTED: uncharacterized protein LOC107191804 [Dufourea novaeangliae]|uniref:uncharacterized protein LOC107191804 n=1 Tax=Dufourea novaeangliae TaxID=178035 RepID=UPI000766F0D6|nr:PREDICTED: uncharacterized protein LOC107191804 [Dufourea novaeangliae]